jgi:hypothetical protein
VNPGLSAAHACSGDDAPAITAWTPATKARTTGVSRTISSFITVPLLATSTTVKYRRGEG